jgi:histidinol dehydrogenase
MRIIRDIETARSTLLNRASPERYRASQEMRREIREIFGEELTIEQVVERIVSTVRDGGDSALLDYTEKLDGVALEHLEVTAEEIDKAQGEVSPEFISALNLAAERIRSFHIVQRQRGWTNFMEDGVGQIVHPLERIGVYIPGGSACYPSTVLMTVIPARVAGVGEVILTTPPGKGGKISPETLAAADIAGINRIFKVGGAQAIAALAFGTESIPRVDKICGPGNIFVTLAKKMVYGEVGIDGLYGPTETMIIADESADPTLCAADLLAQAEHDVMASAIMLTTSEKLASEVEREVECQMAGLERQDIAATSLKERGGIVIVNDVDHAIELANSYAPEHLCLMVQDASSYINKIQNAGGIFVGENSAEALGDYVAGPSHVMPTGGSARFSSPLGVGDFLKVCSLVDLNEEALKTLGPPASTIARSEGFTAHARAAEARQDKLNLKKRKRG